MNETLTVETKACCRTAHAEPARQHKTQAFWADTRAWRKAAANTLNCLIGCSIGDFATIVIIQTFFPATPMFLTMVLAMAAGLFTSILFESTLLRFREKFAWGAAFKMAFSMSFLSMLGMELAANATDLMLTGGKVPVGHPYYWTALGISLAAGFVAPLPYNYYKFKKHGKACH